jgi:hypothetical protein
MTLADSILQTASIVECVRVDVTPTHHTIFESFAQAARSRPETRFSAGYLKRETAATVGNP